MSVGAIRGRRSPWIAGVGVAALLLAGCSGSEGTPPAGVAGPPKAQRGGSVTVATQAEPSGFNVKTPKSNTIAGLSVMARVWPSVWRTTPRSELVLDGELMTSAEVTSTDPQTVVYKIRPEAVWSDGVPIDAEDFIYAWQSGRPGAKDVDGSPIQGPLSPDAIAGVTGSDGGKTVTVVFSTPFRQWKTLFSLLVPAHIAKRVGWNTGFDTFDPNVVVSGGPLRIASYNPGRDLTLARNDRYWGTPANLDQIVVRFTGAADPVGPFNNGEVDVIHAFAPDADILARAPKPPTAVQSVQPGPSQEYVGFNLRNTLLAVPEVRKAFALALDRPAILQRSYGDGHTAIVNDHLFGNGDPEYRDLSAGRYDRPDVPAAKRFLEGAGFVLGADGVYAKEGRRLSFRVRTDSTNATRQIEEQLVQAQVRLVGIELRIDNAPLNALLPQLQSGDYDVEVLQYPKNPLGTPATYRTGNRWGYSSATVGELIVRATNELDDANWRAAMDRLRTELWNDVPVVPLFQVPRLTVVRTGYLNIEDNPSTAVGPFWNAEAWARKA